jgi:hypothetical protein
MKTFKGQSAMEYLATYGWAILLMFVAVAFLIGSGIFDSSRYTSEDCYFQPNLPCRSHFVQPIDEDNARVGFEITNSMGFPIVITGTTATIDETQTTISTGPIWLRQGDSAYITMDVQTPSMLDESNFAKIYMTLDFHNCNSVDNIASGCRGNTLHHTTGKVFAYARGEGSALSTPESDNCQNGEKTCFGNEVVGCVDGVWSNVMDNCARTGLKCVITDHSTPMSAECR